MQKVQVFSVGTPKSGTAKAKRRYRVKWRVDGRGRTRSLKTRAEADRLKSRLEAAVRDGEAFDTATGEPVSWQKSDLTWFVWACDWLKLKWPQWAGSTRKSCVEYLVAFTPSLLREGAPSVPAGMRSWLWRIGFNPAEVADEKDPYFVWLSRWSVPLADIGPVLLEDALRQGTLRLDGNPVMASVAKRRRNGLKSVLKIAVVRGLIPANPMDRVVWRVPRHETQVDVTVLLSVADIDELLNYVNGLGDGSRYAAFFACCGFAGMRPSEAAGLRRCDLTLPDDGWGMAILRGAITSPGSRYTNDGDSRQRKELKHRPVNAIREVPLDPVLVGWLKRHCDDWLDEGSGLVFVNHYGNPFDTKSYGDVWSKARQELWPDGHRFAQTTVYDLRHCTATTWLRAGVPPAEVAKRLGHGVDVLMREYAGVFDGERDRSNQIIETELADQRGKAMP